MATSKQDTSKLVRCGWVGDDPLYQSYHDTEWGVPEYDSEQLLEKLILDGAQAGLSWITILRKRENYRNAFENFDPQKVSRYKEKEITRLMQDVGIVRNRMKIESAITNAKAYLKLQEDGIDFSEFLWQFVGGKPMQPKRKGLKEVPASTPESIAMSKALKSHGFKFCGPTIVYAFMQAVGMVNDHTIDCFRHKECQSLS